MKRGSIIDIAAQNGSIIYCLDHCWHRVMAGVKEFEQFLFPSHSPVRHTLGSIQGRKPTDALLRERNQAKLSPIAPCHGRRLLISRPWCDMGNTTPCGVSSVSQFRRSKQLCTNARVNAISTQQEITKDLSSISKVCPYPRVILPEAYTWDTSVNDPFAHSLEECSLQVSATQNYQRSAESLRQYIYR